MCAPLCVGKIIWIWQRLGKVVENNLGLHPNLKAFETKQRMCKLIMGYLKKGPILLEGVPLTDLKGPLLVPFFIEKGSPLGDPEGSPR